MKKNVGKNDQIIRLILGIVIIILGVYYKNWWGLIGLVLFLTAFGWCPIYKIFGLSTVKKEKEISSETKEISEGVVSGEEKSEITSEEKKEPQETEVPSSQETGESSSSEETQPGEPSSKF